MPFKIKTMVATQHYNMHFSLLFYYQISLYSLPLRDSRDQEVEEVLLFNTCQAICDTICEQELN